MAGALLGRPQLFHVFLWQINPRSFLVSISVGCVPIKLLFLFYNKGFSLIHSAPNLWSFLGAHRISPARTA